MSNFLEILNNAIDSKISTPKSEVILKALLEAEKFSHKHRTSYQFEQLIGNWQLYFITGTKKSQTKFGNLIGSGFYIPNIFKIIISYKLTDNLIKSNQGRIENIVKFGLVQFCIDGPCKFMNRKNIIAFDFTYLKMYILGQKTYEMNIRNGRTSEDKFYESQIKNQAFFSYFLVTDNFIAARGRGGGLALWKKY